MLKNTIYLPIIILFGLLQFTAAYAQLDSKYTNSNSMQRTNSIPTKLIRKIEPDFQFCEAKRSLAVGDFAHHICDRDTNPDISNGNDIDISPCSTILSAPEWIKLGKPWGNYNAYLQHCNAKHDGSDDICKPLMTYKEWAQTGYPISNYIAYLRFCEGDSILGGGNDNNEDVIQIMGTYLDQGCTGTSGERWLRTAVFIRNHSDSPVYGLSIHSAMNNGYANGVTLNYAYLNYGTGAGDDTTYCSANSCSLAAIGPKESLTIDFEYLVNNANINDLHITYTATGVPTSDSVPETDQFVISNRLNPAISCQ